MQAAQPDQLFVYGSLMDATRRISVLGHDCPTRPARLADYEVRQGKWPYLVPAGGTVDGLVLLDLSAADFMALDDYEDLAQGLYARTVVRVTSRDGATMECWVYFAQLAHWPEEWK